jgi:phosphate-selective porin OprO/OprP
MSTTLYAVDNSTVLNDIEQKIQQTQRNIHQAEMLIRRQQSELKMIQDISIKAQGKIAPEIIQSNLNSIWDKIDTRMSDVDSTFRFGTADGRNWIALHGWLESDGDIFMNASGLTINEGIKSIPIINQNTAVRFWLNRARPIIEGTIEKYMHFLISSDLGQSQKRLYDAFVDFYYYRLFGLRIGKQPSLASTIQNFVMIQIYHTLQPGFTTLLAPNRENGFVMYGTIGPYRPGYYDIWVTPFGFDDWLSYQVGILSGTADGTNPGLNPVTVTGFNSEVSSLSNKAFEGRVFMNPFMNQNNEWLKHLGVGFSGSAQTVNNEYLLPAILSPGLNPIFVYKSNVYANGPRSRVHPQMYWYYDRFALVADVTQTMQNITPTYETSQTNLPRIMQLNRAGEIQLIYNLTPEKFHYDSMIPLRNFKILEKGATGAFQMTLRMSHLSMDSSVFQDSAIIGDQKVYAYSDPRISVSQASTFSVTLHWYWNEFLRWSTEYDQTSFVGGCSTGGLNAPVNPGCLTAGAYATAATSTVVNRPTEKLIMQRIQLIF